MRPYTILVISLFLTSSALAAVTVTPSNSAPLKFAAAGIERAAAEKEMALPDVSLSISDGVAQSFSIERDGNSVKVTGGDAVGGASEIIPLVNRFHWRDWDYQWSVENSNSHVEGFRGVDSFADNPTMQGSGLVSVRDFVYALQKGAQVGGTTPLDVADQLDALAQTARNSADRIEGDNRDLVATLDDIRGMAWLGNFQTRLASLDRLLA